jgi:hypothetical protein
MTFLLLVSAQFVVYFFHGIYYKPSSSILWYQLHDGELDNLIEFAGKLTRFEKAIFALLFALQFLWGIMSV